MIRQFGVAMHIYSIQEAIVQSDLWPVSRETGLGIDYTIRLTPHFSLPEFAVSAEHPDLARMIGFWPDEAVRIQCWCWMYGEPIRTWAGDIPVVVLSGKRSDPLNIAVKGSKHSDHKMRGFSFAGDFWIPDGPSPAEIVEFVQRELPLFKEIGPYYESGFVHLASLDHTLKRGEFFIGD